MSSDRQPQNTDARRQDTLAARNAEYGIGCSSRSHDDLVEAIEFERITYQEAYDPELRAQDSVEPVATSQWVLCDAPNTGARRNSVQLVLRSTTELRRVRSLPQTSFFIGITVDEEDDCTASLVEQDETGSYVHVYVEEQTPHTLIAIYHSLYDLNRSNDDS